MEEMGCLCAAATQSHESQQHRIPWPLSGGNIRAFCQNAAERGILLAPGDCFDAPWHLRLDFAAVGDKLPDALNRLGEFITSWSVSKRRRSAIDVGIEQRSSM
jgi:hypothetical protein